MEMAINVEKDSQKHGFYNNIDIDFTDLFKIVEKEVNQIN